MSAWERFKDKARAARAKSKDSFILGKDGQPRATASDTQKTSHNESNSVSKAVLGAGLGTLNEPKTPLSERARVSDRTSSVSEQPPIDLPLQNNVITKPDSIKQNSSKNADAAEKLPPVLQSPNGQDLWTKAFDSLDELDQQKLTKIRATEMPEDQHAMLESNFVDSILSDLRLLKDEDRKQSYRPIISKLINGILKFKSLADVALKFDTSGYGASAWSVVSFGLEIAKNAKDAREFVLSSSAFIADIMARYLEYDCLYRGSLIDEKLDSLITEVYKDMLRYTLAINEYIRQSAWVHHARAVVPLAGRTMSDIKESAQKADQNVQLWLPIVREKLDRDKFTKLQQQIERITQPVYFSTEQNQRIQGFLERSDREAVLSWLPDQATQEAAHVGIRNKTLIKTAGLWIIELQEFKQWQNSRDSCGLWLRGALGTGKTVLTSTVVNHFSSLYKGTAQGSMAYYYCSGVAGAKPTSSDILQNLLRQLVATDTGFDLFRLWKTGRERRDLTNETAVKLIKDMVKLSVSQITIIIDALDEVDRDSGLYIVEFLEDLINQDSSGLVKVFISSREEDRIDIMLGMWPQIKVDPSFTRDDLENYIDTRVVKSLHLRPNERVQEESLRVEVRSFLKSFADGMFRYIELAIPWICQFSKSSQVRQAMKEIPTDLSGIYQELFARIETDPLPSNRELARRAISWVYAAQMQLHTNEFLKAVSSGYEEYRETVTCEDVISCCHHLLTYNASSNTIEFSHFSVVQFVEKMKHDQYGNHQVHGRVSFLCLNAMWEMARVQEQALETVSVVGFVNSLRKLTCDPVHGHENAGVSTHETFTSFWYYTTNYWAFHCERSGANIGTPGVWEQPLALWCEIMQATTKVPVSESSDEWNGINSISHRIPEKSAKNFIEWIFMVSCAFGLFGTLRGLIQMHPQLVQAIFDDIGGIHLAARWGHVHTVQLLCSSGTTIDLPDTASWTPLAYAIRGKHENVILYLLSVQANPNSTSLAGVCLLDLATDTGFDRAVALLTNSGARRVGDYRRLPIEPKRQLYNPPHFKGATEDDLPFSKGKHLGSGGFGYVEIVVRRDPPHEYLITKRLLVKHAPKGYDLNQDFAREVDSMTALVHEHITKIVATYELSSKGSIKELGFAMLPVGDGSLIRSFREIERGTDSKISRAVLQKWMICLSSAVSYMHSRSIRHGDIKPANIIYKGEEIFFIDFSTSVDHSVVKWSRTWRAGTPRYMAPEVLKYEMGGGWNAELLAAAGFPADIYSLGVVFAEMATIISGARLRDFEDAYAPQGFVQLHFLAPGTSGRNAQEWIKKIDSPYADLICKMLSENSNDRPLARQVLDQLRTFDNESTCDRCSSAT